MLEGGKERVEKDAGRRKRRKNGGCWKEEKKERGEGCWKEETKERRRVLKGEGEEKEKDVGIRIRRRE